MSSGRFGITVDLISRLGAEKYIPKSAGYTVLLANCHRGLRVQQISKSPTMESSWR